MSAGDKIVRLIAGLLLVVVIVAAVLALLPRWTPTLGATEAEIQRTLPGDELIARAPGDSTNGATIDAPPEQVWPWIAQIGDVRGGFYSYTFIENLLSGQDLYHNAGRILPQFQDPQPGDGMVMDSLRVHSVEPGKWLLAAQASKAGDFDWVWLWHVEPVGTGQSRLVVRSAMRIAGLAGSPVVSAVAGAGSFVMNRRMIDGLKLRAEGGAELPAVEAVEIVLWVAALLAGLAAAFLFVARPAWQAPLLLGLAALLTLIWFTFWQPLIGLRLLLDLALFLLLWRVARFTRRPRAAPRPA
jgi:hypothetical protein